MTGETIESTLQALSSACHALCGRDLATLIRHDIPKLSPDIESLVSGSANARCALELAALDAHARQQKASLIELMGGSSTRELLYSAIISSETPQKVEALLSRAAAFGFEQIKLKVGQSLEQDLENIRTCQRICGEHIELRVDANAAWDLEQATKAIGAMMDLGVFIFEQPLPVAGDEALPSLRDRVGERARIILDESLCSMEDARRFVKQKAVDGFNLKISKLGGLGPSLQIQEVASAAGLTCQLGAHVGESSLMASVGVLFAALVDDLTALEGCYAPLLLAQDVTRSPLMFGPGGMLNTSILKATPGLGVAVDLELVEEYAKQCITIE